MQESFILLFTDRNSNSKVDLLKAVNDVLKEGNKDIEAARVSIYELNVAFPEVSCAIQTTQAIEVLLTTTDIMANELAHAGKIEEKEKEAIHEMILKMEQKVKFFPPAFERTGTKKV